MTLQRWENVAARKGPESKGGIDPGKQPSFLSLPPASSSSSNSPLTLSPLISVTLSLCRVVFPHSRLIFLPPCLFIPFLCSFFLLLLTLSLRLVCDRGQWCADCDSEPIISTWKQHNHEPNLHHPTEKKGLSSLPVFSFLCLYYQISKYIPLSVRCPPIIFLTLAHAYTHSFLSGGVECHL